MSRARDRADGDFAGKELILDADADTSITVDTDDQIDIRINGSDQIKLASDEVVFNEQSIDVDFRVEGNGDANALFVEGETDHVGIGTNDPADKCHIYESSGQRIARFEANNSTSAHIAFKASNTSLMPTVGVKDEDLYFSTGDAVERARFDADSNGDLILQTGNLVIGTNGKGIDFSATADGSGANQAELLNDYEEGTWTPTLPGGGTVNSVSNARYTKIGQLVYVGVFCNLSPANNSTLFSIGGLPFAVAGSSAYYSNGSVTYVNTFNWAALDALGPSAYAGNSAFYFHVGDANAAELKGSNVQSLGAFIVGLSYVTDS